MSSFYEMLKARYLNRFMPLSSKKMTVELYDLRNLLLNQSISAHDNGNHQVLVFNADDYLRASFHEVLRFSSRGLISFNDFCLNPRDTSRSWRYVTLYYSLYFFIVSFGRMAGRSVIYLDKQEALRLSTLIGALTQSTISLTSGNYLCSLDNPDDPFASRQHVEISILKLSSGSHENAWQNFYQLLLSWKNVLNGKGLATVTGMINCLKHSTSIFSETRNRVNYRGVFALKEIDNSILHLGANKLSMNMDDLDREVATKTGRISGDDGIMQDAHTLGAFFYFCHRQAFRDLSSSQPHPGTDYIKTLLTRIDM